MKIIVRNRGLLWELVKRDFLTRYKGSVLGIAWSLFTPIMMLAIYTFVFSVAFNARWGVDTENRVSFAIVLFSGLIVHGLFSECILRAPMLITSNPNYAKKVIFPLEILPFVSIGTALGQFCISFCVLLAFCLVSLTPIHWTGWLIPVVLLPLVFMLLGFGFFLSATGVYIRDLAQAVGMIATIALFVAPIFYPISVLPPAYQNVLFFNPITLPVIQLRNVLLWGEPLNWVAWAISLLIGIAIFCLGFMWFQKTKRGFADVL
ncbi:MAG: ABC transporter permease [Pseudomonadota bacterium]